MKRIYTYGGSLEKRNLTVADIIESKKSGKKLTQVTAQNAEEAEIISDQNVDMIITGSDWFADVRSGARNTFITAALFAGRYITNEEILEGAIKAAKTVAAPGTHIRNVASGIKHGATKLIKGLPKIAKKGWK